MTTKTTTTTDLKVLKAVTARVVDSFTAQGALFTALDVSNAVKVTLPQVRHREVSPLVRELFTRRGLGEYIQSQIDVLAEGTTKTQAMLYHLPEHPSSLYDDSMRTQLAIPPVSTSTLPDDAAISPTTAEAPVIVGRDGRGRVPRQLILNAGIGADPVLVSACPEPPSIEIGTPDGASEGGIEDTLIEEILFEHPTLLHIPRRFMVVFDAGRKLVARVVVQRVVIEYK